MASPTSNCWASSKPYFERLRWPSAEKGESTLSLLSGNEIIQIAVQLEEQGEEYYSSAAQTAVSPALRSVFLDLADQERHHRSTFERMAGAGLDQAFTAEQWEEFQAYAQALLHQRLTDSEEGSLKRAELAATGRKVIEAAIGFERETLEFYRQLREVVRAKEQQAVDAIIQEEQSHVARLSALLATMN
jgi:rubrerythrin